MLVLLQTLYNCEFSDLDFNGTLQTVEFTADMVPFSETAVVSLYNDGAPEGEEGFVVLLGVFDGDLDEEDRNFVQVVNQVLQVRLVDGGEYSSFKKGVV